MGGIKVPNQLTLKLGAHHGLSALTQPNHINPEK